MLGMWEGCVERMVPEGEKTRRVSELISMMNRSSAL